MPFQKGNTLGKGRPKGETLKEWMRRTLLNMDDKERKEFLKKVPPEIQWKMAEGLPEQGLDIKGEIIVRPTIYGDNNTTQLPRETIPAIIPICSPEVQDRSVEQKEWEVQDGAKPTDKPNPA